MVGSLSGSDQAEARDSTESDEGAWRSHGLLERAEEGGEVFAGAGCREGGEAGEVEEVCREEGRDGRFEGVVGRERLGPVGERGRARDDEEETWNRKSSSHDSLVTATRLIVSSQSERGLPDETAQSL